MDVRVLKVRMKQWCQWYNAHYSNDITILDMSTNDSWGDNAKTMFWRMHTRVPELIYKSHPTTQLWNMVNADYYGIPILYLPDNGDTQNDPPPE